METVRGSCIGLVGGALVVLYVRFGRSFTHSVTPQVQSTQFMYSIKHYYY